MTTGFWAPLIMWTTQHALYPLLRIHRANELAALKARGLGCAAQGTFRTHLASKVNMFGEFAACGAYVVRFSGSPEDVDCRACKRLIRKAQDTP